MYLKSLEMQGFKSFPDKTKLVFEKGTTIIVGPNGSGKSNISDAMRWVLGEISSKSIRGTKMEDIIFGGADSRRPMGFAEVSVTFENTGDYRLDCPYDEVTVTRRYYRGGDSEYFINRRSVRLKDVYELFMNTGIGRDGYSIIGQGRIAEIISRKSEERRNIFEDAAGIAKYRHKKTETERKLTATEENMTRISDVFSEVEAQVLPLEKEAERAKRAIDLLETKKKADVQLWLYDTDKLRKDIAENDELFRHAEFDLNTADEAIADFEKQNDHLFEASQANKVEADRLFRLIKEQTDVNYRLESEYKVAERNILHTEELCQAAKTALATAERTSADSENAILGYNEKIRALQEEVRRTEEEHASVEKSQKEAAEKIAALDDAIATALEDIRALESRAVDAKVRISVFESAKNTDKDKNAAMLAEIEGYQKIYDELSAKADSKQQAVNRYGSEIQAIDESLGALTKELSEHYTTQLTEQKNVSDACFHRDSVAQRIETFRTMEEHFEGYNASVRFVMQKYAEGAIVDASGVRCSKIYGPLSKVISVEDRYVTAIETALGMNLQNIVVADENAAKAAMYALKQAEAGRATFFPLTSMSAQTPTAEMKQAEGFRGYIGVADALVSCDGKFRNVVSNLLGRTVIFDNIDNATTMARSLRYRVRAVTLDGQQINVGGSFTGGAFRQKNGILSREGEIKRLEIEWKALSENVNAKQEALRLLDEEIRKKEDEKASLEERRNLMSVLQNTETVQLEQIKAKIEANAALLSKLSEDLQSLNELSARQKDDMAVLSEEEKALQKQIGEISEYRLEKDRERNIRIDARDEMAAKATELYIRINDLRKDADTQHTLMENERAHIRDCQSEIALQTQKIEEYKTQIQALEEANRQNRMDAANSASTLEQLNAERAQLEEDSFDFERKLSIINSKMKEKMAQKETVYREYTRLENKLAQLHADQDKLASKLWDEHELTRAEALELGYPPIDAKSRPEVAAKQTECKNRLRAIGNVDLDAVNKYNEVKTRYDYMKAQIKDLTEAKNDLVSIIEKLEKEMKTAFITAFNQINENFNRVFAELFGGGSAELSLTEPDDVLTSGIEIKAAPPGKIIKSLMQLSGGEQAFVATALFFAILQVNPTPFCILDEIEAALDEVNVVRFAQYIKRYSAETQFIIITHRRGTMEAANRLYGVTMPEHGISKVLALDVGEISKAKGDNWDGIFG